MALRSLGVRLHAPRCAPRLRSVAGGRVENRGSDAAGPKDDVCWFCEYLAGWHPFTILHEDDLTATLITSEQRGLPHLLVIPRRHRETILDLTDDESSAVMRRVRDVARLIARVHDPDGIAVWQNKGVPAHQPVPHVHVHVAGTLPGGGTEWGPVTSLGVEATDAIAERLRALPS